MKFDFNDILLTPEAVSPVNSRKEVNHYDENGMLPVIVAPMDTVLDKNNVHLFTSRLVYAAMPRQGKNYLSASSNKFASYGLDEFRELFVDSEAPLTFPLYVLIDVANGHMSNLLDLCAKAKAKHGDKLVLMAGNVANPHTIMHYEQAGIDYIRAGIGNGSACTTTVHSGVGYPMGSLISEMYSFKQRYEMKIKIVADGGFRSYSDICKALALGADYVMLGGMFSKCLEACAPNKVLDSYKFVTSRSGYVPYEKYDEPAPSGPFTSTVGRVKPSLEVLMQQGKLFKPYRGMSTKEVQQAWGRTELKTEEGITKYNRVEYTLEEFLTKLQDYLRSAMSYTGSTTLEEFRGSKYELITRHSFDRFNK